jgi:hypothetical protein
VGWEADGELFSNNKEYSMEQINKQFSGLDAVKSGFGGNDNNQMMEIIMNKECDMQKAAEVEIGSEPMEVKVNEHEVISFGDLSVWEQDEYESAIDDEFQWVSDVEFINAHVIDYYELSSVEEVLARIRYLEWLVGTNSVFRSLADGRRDEFYLLLATPERKYYRQQLAEKVSSRWKAKAKAKHLEPIKDHEELIAILNAGVQPTKILDSDIDMDTLLD